MPVGYELHVLILTNLFDLKTANFRSNYIDTIKFCWINIFILRIHKLEYQNDIYILESVDHLIDHGK